MKYRVEKWDRAEPPDVEELKSRMRSEGYSIFQWSDAAGAFYSDHDHSEDESHWVVSGSMELNVHGFGSVVLNAGDRDFMPAGTIHSARVIGDESVVYLIGAKLFS